LATVQEERAATILKVVLLFNSEDRGIRFLRNVDKQGRLYSSDVIRYADGNLYETEKSSEPWNLVRRMFCCTSSFAEVTNLVSLSGDKIKAFRITYV
jgi:hypothetical protein